MGKRQESLFSGDCPVVLAYVLKTISTHRVWGILGGISREYLTTSSGWVGASVRAAEPRLNVEAQEMLCKKVKT